MKSTAAYRCMPRSRLANDTLAIQALQPEHIESVRLWRNAQLPVLRQQHPISRQQQIDYFSDVVWPALEHDQPSNILLACVVGDRLIGYGGLVHVAWADARAEVSFLLDPEIVRSKEQYARYFRAYLDLVARLAFDDLSLHRLSGETYSMRSAHIEILESAGFQREGRLREHVMIDGEFQDALIHGLLASDWRATAP